MKECTGGSYLVMEITKLVTSDKPLIDIGYQYNYRKFPGFIATEGAGSTEPGDPYLSCFSDIYSNVSVRPVSHTYFLGGNFNACNSIDNHNSMWQSDLAIDKYWATQSVHFRLATKVVLGMGITEGKILFCHDISEESVDKKISTRE